MFGKLANLKRSRKLRKFGIFLIVVLVFLAVVPFLVPISKLDRLVSPKELATADSSFTTVSFDGTNGIDFHYLRTGAGRPRFVLLHGFTFNSFTWNQVLSVFAENGGAVAYDRIPFGLSERLTINDWQGVNPYSPEATLDQLFLFMDRLRIPSAILVGNSAGGTLAVRAALAKPERVDGLILVDAAIYDPPRRFSSLLAKLPQVRRLGPLIARPFGANEALLRSTFADPDRIGSSTRMLRAMNTRVYNWDLALWEFLAAATQQPDITTQLGKIQQPVLVVSGDDDGLVPVTDSARLDSELSNSRLAVLPNCGHVPQEECPEEFIEAVAAWLAGRLE